MPHAPARPCTADPRCPHTRPCPVHRTRRASAHRRGYDRAHRDIAARLQELHPNGPCGRCGAPGSWNVDDPDPLTAGHIDHDGPTVLENYQPEHRSCGNREAGARRRGRP